jgi:hypothetical protein
MNEITKQTGGALATSNEIQGLFGQDKPQLPVDCLPPAIKIMRESPMFQMPDGNVVKEFAGHIIHWHNANQYYKTAFGQGDSPVPDCLSSDGIRPDGGMNMERGPCRTCPLNQFGSSVNDKGEQGEGKACSNTIRLYTLLEGEIIPCLLRCPPSSMGKKDSLMTWLTSASNQAAKAGLGACYQPILVKFTLRKKDFKSGMSASALELVTVSILDPKIPDQMAKLRGLGVVTKMFRESYVGAVALVMASEGVDAVAVETEGSRLPDDISIPF